MPSVRRPELLPSTAFAVVAVLALAAGVAAAQGTLTPFTSARDEIELTRDTRIGSTVLAPGLYQLQHQWIEGRHYLVVRTHATPTAAPSPGTTQVDGMGHEVARVPCRVVATRLGQAGAGAGLTTTLEPDGTATLTEVTISGERRGHVLDLQPQS